MNQEQAAVAAGGGGDHGDDHKDITNLEIQRLREAREQGRDEEDRSRSPRTRKESGEEERRHEEDGADFSMDLPPKSPVVEQETNTGRDLTL